MLSEARRASAFTAKSCAHTHAHLHSTCTTSLSSGAEKAHAGHGDKEHDADDAAHAVEVEVACGRMQWDSRSVFSTYLTAAAAAR